MSFVLLFLLTFLILAYILGKPRWREYRRGQIKQVPFPKAWRKILQRNMPYFKQMPADLQLQLKGLIQVFTAEKRFVGCDGLEITDEIRVTIAAQACLLILNRKTDIYPKLESVLVYPYRFVKETENIGAGGVRSSQKATLMGESWEFGKVVLSWQDTLAGASDPQDGQNVVIHEFAHQLDQENGSANGAPILAKGQNYQDWSSVLSREFDQLQYRAGHGIESVFDFYGATNPAEFFAVATEVFFEKSHQLEALHPELYQQFVLYYQVDPLTWH